MYAAVTFVTVPSDEDDNRAIGQSKKMEGIGLIFAAIVCAGGLIAGVGSSTGNWGAAVGGASGLFFGLVCTGLYKCVE